MPAWTPETEGFAPFEDDDDELRADLPSELAAFLQQFEIGRTFTIEIKKWNNEAYSGRPSLVGRLEGLVPDYTSVVKVNGPGFYGFDTTWVPKGGKAQTKMLKVSLVGPQWTQLHKEAKKEKEKAELEEAKHEAELDRVRNGGAPSIGTYKDPAATGREYMKSALEDMKGLMDVFGVGAGGVQKGGDMNMGMMFMGMMQMMMKSQENSTNLLIAVMGNKDKGNDLLTTMGAFKELMTVRDGLLPRDKSWIEEIGAALVDNLPSLAGLFMRGAPPDDPTHRKFQEGLADTAERAQEDPTFAKALVKHLDKKVGPKMTDKILDGFIHIKRPPPKASPGGQEGATAGAGAQGGTDAGAGEE
jgi:hypothetical protein